MKLDFRNVGIAGSILMAIGPLLPFVSVPLLGSINYVSGGFGDGVFIIAFSGIAFAGTLLGKPNWLLASALASVAILGLTLFNLLTNGGDFTRFVSLQVGPLLILVGAGLLFYAAKQAPEERLSTGKPFKPFSRGNFGATTLGILGALVSLSAPLVLSVLYASITNPSAATWLFSWFILGFTSAALFVMALIASLFLLFRGRMVLSLVSALMSMLFYFQTADKFWASRSKELAIDLLPSLSFVSILPIVGSLLLLIAIGLRALSTRSKLDENLE